MGSPGPFEMNKPSYGSGSVRISWSNGTTLSSTPRDVKHRIWFCFMPTSSASTRMGRPLVCMSVGSFAIRRPAGAVSCGVYSIGILHDTLATRFSPLGLCHGTSSTCSRQSPPREAPGLAARRRASMLPFVRIRFVSARVSIPYTAGTPFSFSQSLKPEAAR